MIIEISMDCNLDISIKLEEEEAKNKKYDDEL